MRELLKLVFRQRIATLIFCSFFLLLFSGCVLETIEKPSPEISAGELVVHFIDVGQGDATLLQGPNFNVLIDAGRHDRHDILPYLQKLGIKSLDLVMGTHPHADHIGQIPEVLNNLEVKEVWLSGEPHTTKTFERVLDAIANSDVGYHEPRAGESYQLGDLRLEILNPEQLTGDFHASCLSVRATYGEVSFLFTGDAEAPTERAMLERGLPLKAQIFQLGHHGSSTSNTLEFLEVVQPEVTIYSAEAGNSYGHPHREVIELLEELEIPVLGTEHHGTIKITTDGTDYQLTTER